MTTICPKCDYERKESDTAPQWQCPNCQAVYEKLEKAIKAGVDVKKGRVIPPASSEQLKAKVNALVLTTTPSVPGKAVDQILEVVSADSTFAFSSLNELVGGIGRAIAGSGASHGTESHLAKCRQEAMKRLKIAAAQWGADAVIGVTTQIAEFSGATGNGVVVVTATGTAVTVV